MVKVKLKCVCCDHRVTIKEMPGDQPMCGRCLGPMILVSVSVDGKKQLNESYGNFGTTSSEDQS